MTLFARISHASIGHKGSVVIRQSNQPDVVLGDGQSHEVCLHQDTYFKVLERTEDGREPASAAEFIQAEAVIDAPIFQFEMGQEVALAAGGVGVIRGRAQHADGEPTYLVRLADSGVEIGADERTLSALPEIEATVSPTAGLPDDSLLTL